MYSSNPTLSKAAVSVVESWLSNNCCARGQYDVTSDCNAFSTHCIIFFILAFFTSSMLGTACFLISVCVIFLINTNLLYSIGVTKVIAMPLFPALPVLPTL